MLLSHAKGVHTAAMWTHDFPPPGLEEEEEEGEGEEEEEKGEEEEGRRKKATKKEKKRKKKKRQRGGRRKVRRRRRRRRRRGPRSSHLEMRVWHVLACAVGVLALPISLFTFYCSSLLRRRFT